MQLATARFAPTGETSRAASPKVIPVATDPSTPRSRVLADAWRDLGDGVEPLSNRAGLPLARTVKLILDPLIVRPVQRPHLALALLAPSSADELRGRVLDAADELRATADWFTMLKKERRGRGITHGDVQELYFPRAFELARRHGPPGPDAIDTVGSVLDEIHGGSRVTAADLREYITLVAAEVDAAVANAWSARAPIGDAPLTDDLDAFDQIDGAATSPIASAPALWLTVHDTPQPPTAGDTASKSRLPAPFDRSILERLFGSIASLEISGASALRGLVFAEARRTAQPWQLDDAGARVIMTIGCAASARFASPDLPPVESTRRLRERWRREPVIARALRLPDPAAFTDDARAAYHRRLWARLHGRELRGTGTTRADAWDLLDGTLRSVILDHRDRVKAALVRGNRA